MIKYIKIEKENEVYNLRVIKKNTKKAMELIDKYNNTYNYSLFDCYNRPSYTKEAIYKDCQLMYRLLGGDFYKIPSYNIMQFTFAFKCLIDGKRYLIYRTKSYDFAVELE